MKPILFAAVVAVSLMAAEGARADCALSDPPPIPDGGAASEAEMAAAGAAIRKFVAATDEYLACLDFKMKSNPNREKLYNQAVDKAKSVAANYNRQVKLFKAR